MSSIESEEVSGPTVLPLPGFALSKKETLDARELYFTFEHPEGGAVIKLDPNLGQIVREVVLAINQAAAAISCGRSKSTERPGQPTATGDQDFVSALEKLRELREGGTLTDDEFALAKAKLLG